MLRWMLLTLGLSSATAVQVDFTKDWRPGIGWELVCTWSFTGGDRLQSVRLEKDDQQFKIYRPEAHGPSIHDRFFMPGSWTQLDCSTNNRTSGQCTLTMDLQREPSVTSRYACEVSGERPRFDMARRSFDLVPYVASTDAAIQVVVDGDKSSDRVLLNCTASGLPAPELNWIVGAQKVQGDFFSGSWNSTTKLRHAWSILAITRPTVNTSVLCNTVQHTKGGMGSGPSAELWINSADRFTVGYRIGGAMFVLLFLLR